MGPVLIANVSKLPQQHQDIILRIAARVCCIFIYFSDSSYFMHVLTGGDFCPLPTNVSLVQMIIMG